jgi:hypothetical protein
MKQHPIALASVAAVTCLVSCTSSSTSSPPTSSPGATAAIAPSTSTSTAPAATTSAAPTSAPAASKLEGVWRSDGSGYLVAVKNAKATMYQTTQVSCFADPIRLQQGLAWEWHSDLAVSIAGAVL